MEVSIRKIGNAQGIIFPNELNLEVGARYRIEQSGPALIMTPINSELLPIQMIGWVFVTVSPKQTVNGTS